MNYVSRWPLFVHMASASICMLMSAFYHLYFVYSPALSKHLAKLDYAGISILICGSTMPIINYLLACGDFICKAISVISVCFRVQELVQHIDYHFLNSGICGYYAPSV